MLFQSAFVATAMNADFFRQKSKVKDHKSTSQQDHKSTSQRDFAAMSLKGSDIYNPTGTALGDMRQKT